MNTQNHSTLTNNIRLKKPDTLSGNDPRNGCFNFLQVDPWITKDVYENDVAAGARQFRDCAQVLRKTWNKHTVIQADNLEEALLAVSYMQGMKQEHEKEKAWEFYHSLAVYEEIDEEFIPDDEAYTIDEEDDAVCDEERQTAEYIASQQNSIPIIDTWDILRYYGRNDMTMIPEFNKMHAVPQPVTPPPYWTELANCPICIVLSEEDSLVANNGRFMRYLHNFDDFSDTYFLFIRQSEYSFASDPCCEEGDMRFDSSFEHYERDPVITRMILEFTANYIDVTCSQTTRHTYHCNLLSSWMSEYGLSLENPASLGKLVDSIVSIDPEQPSEHMEKTIKLMLHEYPSTEVLTMEMLRRMGILNIRKDPVDDVTLDQLVGMETVKEELHSIVDLLHMNRLRKQQGYEISAPHNVYMFQGAPGTAKTTAAKALGHMLREQHILPNDRFISVSGAQLKAPYMGQTTAKVHRLFQDYDIILIDEAYSLASSDNNKIDSYAQEALAQLALELEEHSTDKVVIFAGYGGEDVSSGDNLMQKFLRANPGIESRVSVVVHFPSYNVDEMLTIIHDMARQRKYIMTREADAEIRSYFRERVSLQTFGYGREARVFIENVERSIASRYAKRSSIPKSGIRITKQDIHKTLAYMRKANDSGMRSLGYGIV